LSQVAENPPPSATSAESRPAGAAAPSSEDPAPPPPPSFLGSLWEAVSAGDVVFNLRARLEVVEQEGLDTAEAWTEHARLGYGTRPFHGFSAYLEMEDIRTLDDDRYNAAGLNQNPGKAVVADPPDTELNQGFVRYQHEWLTAIAGRQRIILDDHRFVGNVGWRQNEQTFDAYTLTSQCLPDTDLLYSYVADVNRVFGPDADRDFESDSHLFHASYARLPAAKLTAFAYLLDFDDAPASSSDSVGLRLAGEQGFLERFTAAYTLSYAHQVDAADNPNDYESEYFLAEALLGLEGLGSAGPGYEVLGSDDGSFAFQSPLATLHAFNGWADVFLVTPDEGLEDFYVKATVKLPCEVAVTVLFHWFWAEDTGAELGNEVDAVLSKQVTKNVQLLAKLAVFDGDAGLADVQKYWLQVEVDF
jgi:hypothetical protein